MGEDARASAPKPDDSSTLSRLGRRLITVPLYLLLCLLSILAAPLWIPALLIADLRRRGTRSALRCGAFFAFYFQVQAIGILGSFALWLASGVWAGADRRRYGYWNRRLQWWWARTLLFGAARIFGLRFHVEGEDVIAPGPILLMPRHASMADTLLSTVYVEAPHRLFARYVLKNELLWDPCIDIVGNRIPTYFVRRESSDSAREIAAVGALMEGLGSDEVFMIYPEGTRFTPEKREKVIARLRERGHPELAARAEKLQHTLPPRLGGPLIALQKNPGADAVFCAHEGFEAAATLSDLWKGRLVDRDIHIAFWRIPYSEIPADRDGQVEWLFDQWARIDAWIAKVRAEHA